MNHLTWTMWGNGGIYLGGGAGGGGGTIENMSDDARTRFRVSMRASPLRRAPTRVSTGYEYVCRYALAYVYARAGGRAVCF